MFRSLVLTAVLAGALAGCATPADLDLSLRHPSLHDRYVVALDPPAAPVSINQIQAWQIRLTAPDGTPVPDARIAVDGGMPAHGHGLPTRPRVGGTTVAGAYAMDGMKFSMGGWWEIRLAIEGPAGADTAVFNVVVDASGLKR